jgi:ABC-type dipeptide/oligopeptide/nickel transport system permease component
LKTKVKRLGKEKIFSDVFGILLISLFPPIIYFLIGERLESLFRSLFNQFEITGTSSEILLFSELRIGFGYLLFAIACSFIIVSIFELLALIHIPKQKLLIAGLLLLIVFLFFDAKEVVTMLFYSKNAFITIGILTVLLIGEFILFNNIIVQNISKEDHIMTASAIGYSNQKIFKDHIIRNSFFPFATRIAINLPYTIASLVIVESTTGWGGMGSMLYRAIMSQDSNAAMAILFLLAILTATLRLGINFSQIVFNPQLRGTRNV